MSVYYNEHDPFPAAWLRNLVDAGHIANGRVDARDIRAVQPADLASVTQAHFFAGIGVWSYALRLAGWSDATRVWTGSCPCQPFSGAGKRRGKSDERHLWPEWFRLIRECRPPVLFGEQVASPDGLDWLDSVFSDLEAEGYAVGGADLPAAGVGAPHIRQRLFFVAVACEQRREGERLRVQPGRPQPAGIEAAWNSEAGELADANEGQRRRLTDGERRERVRATAERIEGDGQPQSSLSASRLGDASGARGRRDTATVLGSQAQGSGERLAARSVVDEPELAGPTRGFWSNADWIPCLDGVSRPVEPGTFPLAHRSPARVGRLRAYGNAIVPQAAAVFIRAAIESGVT